MSAHRRIKRFDENTSSLLVTPKHRAAAARMRGAQLQPAAPALLQGSATLLALGTQPSGAGMGFTPVFGASPEVPPAAGGLGRSPGSLAPREPPKALPPPAVPGKFGKEATGPSCLSHSESHRRCPLYVRICTCFPRCHPRMTAGGCRSLLLRPSRPRVSSRDVSEAWGPLASTNHSAKHRG